ncbi:SMP-30/gluconolactonase/LRE family protein [Litorilinea aerophila]|nr:NHL repeat-containing protein [Litorilinea aerophila]MCC9075204.1 SMP-30/gluconolactonase/LRE family protein [Litorilinea aerophila]
MKARVLTGFCPLFCVALFLALLPALPIAAQGLQPPGPAEILPAPEGPPLAGPESKPSAPFAEAPKMETQSVDAAAIPLGQPGLSFRYVQTFGVSEVAYTADTLHLNFPYGIGTDGSNIWIGEQWGNRVLQYDHAGNFKQQFGCARFPDGCGDTSFWEIVDVAVDGGGNIWVVDATSNRVVQLDPSGQKILELGEMWVEGNSNSQFVDPISVAFDANGNIYVSDGAPFWNRERGNHRIQIFQSNGTYLATLGQTGICGSGQTQFCGPRHITIYGTELYVADAGNNRVQIFNITNPASPGYVATIGGLNNPSGVAVDANYIYVADTWNDQVRVFHRSTRAHVTTIGAGWGTDNNQFKNPSDVAVDAMGNLYVADWVNTRVQQFFPSGSTWNYIRTYGVTGVPYVTDGYHYNTPTGIAIADDGNFYLTEEHGHRLNKLSPDGTPIWAVGAAGVKGDWDHSNDRLNNPDDVAVDANGRVYVADRWHNRVQIYNPDGSYHATIDGLECPGGVALAPSNGYLYVANSCNHTVRIYNTGLELVATLGTPGQAGTDHAHFNLPEDVAVDSNGTIYVSDRDNHRVQVFDANRQYVRTMGETGIRSNDFAHFNGPNNLFVDNFNRLYVADEWNNRIQVFDEGGNYLTTIGGSWGSRTGQFRGARGVTVDSAGNVYVTDTNNHRIQKFAPGVPGWKQVNINGFGERQNTWISNLVNFKGHLYASGYRPYVWRLENDGSWSTVNNLGFGDSTNVEIDAMAVFNNHLYAATFTFICDDPDCNNWHTNGPQFWRTADGTTWENVTPPGSIGTDYRWVPTMAALGGYLYATLDRQDHSTLGAEIWRTADGQNWQQIASGGFGDPYNTGVLSLVEYNGYLYAGTRHGDWQNDAHSDGPLGGEVWRYDGTNWVRVNDPGFGDLEAHRVERLIVFNNALYAFISRVVGTTKGAEIWRCIATICNSQNDWVKVVDNGFGNPQNQYIFGGLVTGGYLYAATQNTFNGFRLWRTINGTDWEPAALEGLGDSNNTYVWLNAMAEHNGRLYLGVNNSANGAEVWEMQSTQQASVTITDPSQPHTLEFNYADGGKSMVSVPANLLPAGSTLVYAPFNLGWRPPNHRLAGRAFQLNVYQGGILQENLSLSSPIQVTIDYTDAEVFGLDEELLVLLRWDPDTLSWTDAACGPYNRQPAQNRLSVPVCHLSLFGLFGEQEFIYLPVVER